MSGLAIIVVGPDPARARRALGIAAAAAALGREAALLFDGDSVTALPAVAEPLATALAMGVRITACATGLADHGIALPAGLDAAGLIGFMTVNTGAELLTV